VHPDTSPVAEVLDRNPTEAARNLGEAVLGAAEEVAGAEETVVAALTSKNHYQPEVARMVMELRLRVLLSVELLVRSDRYV
jgi:hypothetical protein